MKRSLILRRETLAELDAHDLAAIVGAAGGGQLSNGAGAGQCLVSIALKACGTSVNPKCPGVDA